MPRSFGPLERMRQVHWPASLKVQPKVTRRQMDRWAGDFDNWAVCDGCCLHLFAKVPFAQEKVPAWCVRSQEFVKRASFSMMDVFAVHDKNASDFLFLQGLRLIKNASADERSLVKKAVNWLVRQIGERNLRLNGLLSGRRKRFRNWIQLQPAGLQPTYLENRGAMRCKRDCGTVKWRACEESKLASRIVRVAPSIR